MHNRKLKLIAHSVLMSKLMQKLPTDDVTLSIINASVNPTSLRYCLMHTPGHLIIIITIVLSYTGKYHEFVAVCIVMSVQHE